MIRVDRPRASTDVLAALTKPGHPDNKTELEKAREYYNQVPPPKKAYKFVRYKEWAVCRALDDLFHNKCAYCETNYSATDSRDVEHYRPKGGVTESLGKHPGYWWLAAVWENLLPSCSPCNQRRRQTLFDPKMTLEEFELKLLKKPDRLSGKANAFPVRGDNWVTSEGGDLKVEDPFLINPCARDPANHLEFFFDWKDRTTYIWEATPIYPLVRPRLSAGGDDDLYAKHSIAIYGLNRKGLIEARARLLKGLQMQCQSIVDLINDLMVAPSGADLARIQARIKSYRAKLEAFAQPDQPYAAMVRAFLLQFEAELRRLEANLT